MTEKYKLFIFFPTKKINYFDVANYYRSPLGKHGVFLRHFQVNIVFYIM